MARGCQLTLLPEKKSERTSQYELYEQKKDSHFHVVFTPRLSPEKHMDKNVMKCLSRYWHIISIHICDYCRFSSMYQYIFASGSTENHHCYLLKVSCNDWPCYILKKVKSSSGSKKKKKKKNVWVILMWVINIG